MSDIPDSGTRPLAGFDRVDLNPGQSKTVTIAVPARQLQYWSESAQRWMNTTGTRTVYVGTGDSASTLTLHASAQVDRYAHGVSKMKGMAARHLALEIAVTATRV